MSEEAVRLQSPLHDSRNQEDSPVVAMKEPAGDQVFSDGEFREFANAVPGLSAHHKSATWAPSSVDPISRTIFSASTSGVSLIQDIVCGNIVVELLMSAYHQITVSGISYLSSSDHANCRILNGMWN